MIRRLCGKLGSLSDTHLFRCGTEKMLFFASAMAAAAETNRILSMSAKRLNIFKLYLPRRQLEWRASGAFVEQCAFSAVRRKWCGKNGPTLVEPNTKQTCRMRVDRGAKDVNFTIACHLHPPPQATCSTLLYLFTVFLVWVRRRRRSDDQSKSIWQLTCVCVRDVSEEKIAIKNAIYVEP